MRRLFWLFSGLVQGQTLNSFSAKINLDDPCENTVNCTLNLQAITAVACEGLFNCSGVFTWPDDTPPDGIGTEAIKNPLLVEDDTKAKCDGSSEIIAIPGQFEADPYNQLPDFWPNKPEQAILEPVMEIVNKIEELNDGEFPCDIILDFSEKCPGSSRPEENLCDLIKDALHAVFELIGTEFPTCLESFECIPDFFADVCPEHIECPEGEDPNSESQVCLPTVAWPRALRINTDTLHHEFIDKKELNTDTILTRGSMYSFYGNKHYFFGGEDVRLDEKRLFETKVVHLDDDGFTRTKIDLPQYKESMDMLYKGFARGAATIYQGKVWICGVGFAPHSCYKFSGKKFDDSDKRLNIGHTDYPSLLSTSKFGLLISGGRTEIAYPERNWKMHGLSHSVFESFDGSRWIELDLDDRTSVGFLASHLSIEIDKNIFIIGGNQQAGTTRPNPTFKLSLPSACAHVFQKNCKAILTFSGSLFQYRQGRGIWKNNVLTMIGNSLFSFGTFHEQLVLDDNDELVSSKVSNIVGEEQSVSMFYDAAVFDACLLPEKSSSISVSSRTARETDIELEYSLTVSFETYDALDSVQQTIEENLVKKSEDTLEKLKEEDQKFEDLDIEEITELTNKTQVEEEILPDIGSYFTFLDYYDCEDIDEKLLCSECELFPETCKCTAVKNVTICDAVFYSVNLEINGKTYEEQAAILEKIKDSIYNKFYLNELVSDSEACEECLVTTVQPEITTLEAETTPDIEITTIENDLTTENDAQTTQPERTTEKAELTTAAEEEIDEKVTILAIILSASYGALCLTAVIGSVFYIFKAKKKSLSVTLLITVLTISIANGIQITFYLTNKMDEATFLGIFILTLLYGAISVPTLLY